jgi:hypothetical protein
MYGPFHTGWHWPPAEAGLTACEISKGIAEPTGEVRHLASFSCGLMEVKLTGSCLADVAHKTAP